MEHMSNSSWNPLIWFDEGGSLFLPITMEGKIFLTVSMKKANILAL